MERELRAGPCYPVAANARHAELVSASTGQLARTAPIARWIPKQVQDDEDSKCQSVVIGTRLP
jgi:hypothetical protein